MKKIVNFDSRWIGEHGIGRFAKEIQDGIPALNRIKVAIKPTSPFDVFFVTLYLMFNRGYYFTPGYNAPFFHLNRTAITIHDLNHIDIDFNSSVLKRLYYNLVLKRACRKARVILTVSEFSKKRICEWAKINQDKVKVVGNGVSKEFNLEVNGLKENYILSVGNRKKHKNEIAVLNAFCSANIPEAVMLYFTGERSEELLNHAKKLNISNRIKFMGRVDNETLAKLYKGANMLLFPSLYEGFGLPVIEAMACGTPVITSNVTSLPEIAGDAALLVDPINHGDISLAIEKIYYDIALRQKLVEEGLKQVKKFTWQKTIYNVKNELETAFTIKL
nr:glycosyltransferase family 1 protein [Klebsiella pneumoniae]